MRPDQRLEATMLCDRTAVSEAKRPILFDRRDKSSNFNGGLTLTKMPPLKHPIQNRVDDVVRGDLGEQNSALVLKSSDCIKSVLPLRKAVQGANLDVVLARRKTVGYDRRVVGGAGGGGERMSETCAA